MPFHRFIGFLHEIVIGLEKLLVFPVLPQVVRGDPPLGIRAFRQGAQALKLLLFVNVQEDLQYQVAAVPQLALKLVHGPDTALVFLFGDFQPQLLADHVFHPAGIQEDELAVFRNRGGIGVQERIPGFAFRNHGGGDHVIEAGIDLADNLLDEAAFAGSGPAFDQYQHRQLFLPQQLLGGNQAGTQLFDFRVEGIFILWFAFLKILKHK